jgi:hypothetical protein
VTASNNVPTERLVPDPARAKNGMPVPEDVVMLGCVVLDCVGYFVGLGKLRAPASNPD